MKAGERYIITTGEYSDYGIRDCFVARRTFSFDNALARWLAEHGTTEWGNEEPEFGYDTGQSAQDFLAWLRAEKLVEDAPCNEVHLCSYSRPEKEPAKDAADDADASVSTPRLRLALQLADAAFTVRSWIGDDSTPSEDATYRGVAAMLDESAKLLKLVDELDGLPDDAPVARKELKR